MIRRKPWTEAEEVRLEELIVSGATFAECAAAMGRTFRSITGKAHRLQMHTCSNLLKYQSYFDDPNHTNAGVAAAMGVSIHAVKKAKYRLRAMKFTVNPSCSINHNALKTHCPAGHPYSGDNLRLTRNGYRRCRECGRRKSKMDYLKATATISDCGLYRYDLVRQWSAEGVGIVFVMLNPSTADGNVDDPTIRRCVSFADLWGFGRLTVVNLFALRSSDPKRLRESVDPIGPENDAWITRHVSDPSNSMIIAAWGVEAVRYKRSRLAQRPPAVLRLLRQAGRVHHLGLASGMPRHPLYLPGDVKPIAYLTED